MALDTVTFRDRPGPFVVAAPGRVNLIGEHTDYNDGFVLPMAIERGVRLAVVPRADRVVVLRSDREPGGVEIDLAAPLAPGRRDWARYPLGVLAGYLERGFAVPGFEADVSADLPAGGGRARHRRLPHDGRRLRRLRRRPGSTRGGGGGARRAVSGASGISAAGFVTRPAAGAGVVG